MSKPLSVFTDANGHKSLGVQLAVLISLANVMPAVSADDIVKTSRAGESSNSTANSSARNGSSPSASPTGASATTAPSGAATPAASTTEEPKAPEPTHAPDVNQTAPSTATSSAATESGKKLAVCDMPAPKGQDAAIKLYTAKKFALAKPQFEKFVIDGTANIDSYAYLAYCLYNLRQYTKAMRVFYFVAQNANHQLTLKHSAENSSRTLRCYMAGICPANCLKANDPRWGHLDGKPANELWIKFPDSDGHSWQAWSQNHIGQLIVYEGGHAVNKGTCPTCNGTGTVPVLKDGAPLPH
jgi:hypothetical protein